MRHLAGALAMVAAAMLWACPASAQTPGAGVALDQLDPAPAGDAFIGVPSPFVGGHLVPRALVLFDYAHRPLALAYGNSEAAIVGQQAFLHLDASLALWDRLLISALLPTAIMQNGDSPTVAGIAFASPSSAALGDLRLGVRVRLFGGYEEPFQIGLNTHLHVPTGPSGSFSGEGAVRVAPGISAGGRVHWFVWTAAAGAMLRGSKNPSGITYGAGAAISLLRDRLQVGPEVFVSTPIQEGFIELRRNKFISRGNSSNAELLFDVRARITGGLVAGVAGGPGLTKAIGTPVFRVIGAIGWSPLPVQRKDQEDKPLDTDADGIIDTADACPQAFGSKNADSKRNGCPIQDGDEDGVADADDACPDVAGENSAGVKRLGCPADRDGDGVPDPIDACLEEKGSAGRDGCPEPEKPEPPADTDGDGILDAADGCPREKGAASTGAAANGCPLRVRVTPEEIVLLEPVKFRVLKSDPAPIDPASEPLLQEVADVIAQHPEFLKIEIQAHTDSEGSAKYNQDMSKTRAESVQKWLVGHGVPAERLVAKGYGPSKPIGDNKTVAGREKNRRVQIVVIEKK